MFLINFEADPSLSEQSSLVSNCSVLMKQNIPNYQSNNTK